MRIEERIQTLGIALPQASKPQAMYIPAKRIGGALFVSGQVPVLDGAMRHPGRVGAEVTLEQAQAAARVCVVNLLSAAKGELGDLDRIKHVVKLQAFVSSAPGFTQQHLVANAASQLLFDVFGEAGRHARTAVGVAGLPMDAPVEIEAILEVE